MALIRWQSPNEVRSIERDLNRVFGTFFDSQTGNGSERRSGRWVPAVDLVDEGEHYVLRADLPGVAEQDVKIEVQDGVLSVSGERHSESESKREGYVRIERSSGSFRRSLKLPQGVDSDAIEASFERGVLQVTIPKPEQPGPQRIAIKVAGETPAAEGEGEGPQAA